MLFSRSFCSLTLMGMALLPLPAAAQYRDDPTINSGYRDGQPMTMDAPVQGPDRITTVKSRFSSAYARARSPRITIFWNRSFNDEVASEYEDYATLNSNSSASGSAQLDAWRTRRSVSADSSVEAQSSTSAEIRSGTTRIDKSRRASGLSEAVDFDVEQAFQSTLAGAGVRLIDRTSIMRSTGAAQKAGERANVQGIETDAILGKSDIVLEIVPMSDSRAMDGRSYKVTARDVRNARILATFSSDGRPPVGVQPYVAGPNGFERARPRDPGPRDIGRELAVETMSRLSGSF